MPQLFSPGVSIWFKTACIVAPLLLVAGGLAAYRFSFSSYATPADEGILEPAAFRS